MKTAKMLVILIILASAAQAQIWKRDIPNESCQQYSDRMAENNYELWRKHYCTVGPRCNVGSAANKTMRPYFLNHGAKCSCTGISWDSSLKAGEIHPCAQVPQNPTIFEDDFESGTLEKWDKIENTRIIEMMPMLEWFSDDLEVIQIAWKNEGIGEIREAQAFCAPFLGGCHGLFPKSTVTRVIINDEQLIWGTLPVFTIIDILRPTT